MTVSREKIVDICREFKQDGYTYLVDLSGADYSTYPGWSGERFCVNYLLYSFQKNCRIRLKVFIADGIAVSSVTSVWRTANWHEARGVGHVRDPVRGHPNLERILMWEGFNGHPLRKDFPVRGIDTRRANLPEVFLSGGGPAPNSTGKPIGDVNVWQGPAIPFGRSPAGAIPSRRRLRRSKRRRIRRRMREMRSQPR